MMPPGGDEPQPRGCTHCPWGTQVPGVPISVTRMKTPHQEVWLCGFQVHTQPSLAAA